MPKPEETNIEFYYDEEEEDLVLVDVDPPLDDLELGSIELCFVPDSSEQLEASDEWPALTQLEYQQREEETSDQFLKRIYLVATDIAYLLQVKRNQLASVTDEAGQQVLVAANNT
jgi:hypothetical protein